MKKLYSHVILFTTLISLVDAQTVDETNGNIVGFNRIQTGSGDWLDIQLVGAGSSFKINDNTNGGNWVRWDAGSSYTDFLKSIRMSADIFANGSRNIIGFNRIQTSSGGWLDIQLVGTGSSFKVRDNSTYLNWVKWTAGVPYTDFLTSVVISNGTLGIGTTTIGTHKLAVEGTIGAREIKVEATGWSDFVFDNDYELRTLEEVENFITTNKHLPEIPSEAEVKENGINLGEMNAKLLQKIEELTLYLIEQNKKLEMANQNIEKLQKKVLVLEKE